MPESSTQQREEDAYAVLKVALNNRADLDVLSRAIQTYCQFRTTIVLGSGASCGFGLPSMSALARKVAAMPELQQDDNLKALANSLSLPGANLEGELNKARLSTELMEKIRRVVWECVSKGQQDFLTQQYFAHSDRFFLARLFKSFLQSSIPNLKVVTTNYDLLAELAADACRADCITGFDGELVSSDFRRDDFTAVRHTKRKTVSVLKVHGSLNWFENVEERRKFAVKSMGLPPAELLTELNRAASASSSFPDPNSSSSGSEAPAVVRPLIIPPSFRKYEEAFGEPYRSLIGFADEAFRSSNTVLCIGYGFNDNHIQEDLRASILDGSTTLIAASMELTLNCLKLIYSRYRRPGRYLLLERLPLHVIFNYYGDGDNGRENLINGSHLPSKDYWSLDEELKAKLKAFMQQKSVSLKTGSDAAATATTVLNEDLLHDFFISTNSSPFSSDWKKQLRRGIVKSEDELLKRILHNAGASAQAMDVFGQRLNDGFELLFKGFLKDLAYEMGYGTDTASNGFDASANVPAAQQSSKTAKADAAFSAQMPEEALSALASSSVPGSAQSNLNNGAASLIRDKFTFIHSSDPALNGRIISGAFWSLEGLSTFFN